MIVQFSHVWFLTTAIAIAACQENLFNPFKSRGSSLQAHHKVVPEALGVAELHPDNRRRQVKGPSTPEENESAISGLDGLRPQFPQFTTYPHTGTSPARQGLGVLNGVIILPNVQSSPKTRTLEDSKSFLLTSQLPHVLESPVTHRFEVVDRQPVVSFSTVIQPQVNVFDTRQRDHQFQTFATQQTVVHEAIVDPPPHVPSLDEVSAPLADQPFDVVVQQPALPVAQQLVQPEAHQPALQAVPQVQLGPTIPTTAKTIRAPADDDVLVQEVVEDPCLTNRHFVIPNEVQRSYNHEWRNGSGRSPVCDNHLAIGWYRFDSPTGNLMPTKCPATNHCGTQLPVWLKGGHPNASDGIVQGFGCIKKDNNCCFELLPIQIRNCSATGHVYYYLPPTPGCNVGYCAGEGVPCPEGFSSRTGFSPCKANAKLKEVLLSVSESSSGNEVIFRCHPMLENVVDPSAIIVDIEWLVDNQMVFEESFPIVEHQIGTLQQRFWRPGNTISCQVRIRHTSVPTETVQLSSDPFYAGIEISAESSTRVIEGETGSSLQLRSTIPIVCNPPTKECCLKITQSGDLTKPFIATHRDTTDDDNDNSQCFSISGHVPIHLSRCSATICKSTWNQTVSIPIFLQPGRSSIIDYQNSVTLNLSVVQSIDHPAWNELKLKPYKVTALPSPVLSTCHLSSPTSGLKTFDGMNYKQNQNGTFVIYRQRQSDYEVQAYFNKCSLRQLCICALAIRSVDTTIIFDICSKGHLQMWATRVRGSEERPNQELSVYSRNEGRSFEVDLPSGALVVLDSLLTEVKVLAVPVDFNSTEGLCGSFDGDKVNDFDLDGQTSQSSNKQENFLTSWKLESRETLFALRGDLNDSRDASSTTTTTTTTTTTAATLALNSADDGVCLLKKGTPVCHGDVAVLGRLLALGSSADYDGIVKLETEQDGETPEGLEDQFDIDSQFGTHGLHVDDHVAEISLTHSQPQNKVEDDWTRDTAFVFCEDFLQKSSAYENCQLIPDFDVHSYVRDCREDLFFSHNPTVTIIHLNRLKTECREVLFRMNRNHEEKMTIGSNATQSESRNLLYFHEIAGSLCPNDCSGKGQCIAGRCECAEINGTITMGGDCSVDMSAGPRVSSLANFGLCDVRTKPCRDVVVLTDHLADNPSLHCVFELYKVRGVASKQLVNDAVLDVPLVFLSHEQAVCRLPKLDIHEPEDISKFDLGDNTDHTRLFLKLHLVYGDGPRSSPLDLLLYDSVCWDCTSTGQCRANIREHRCFFSSGTSTVQVFRIGRKITTVSKDFHVCTLPKDTGSCDNKIFRYYYNAIERRCKLFVFGGCKGNDNNFLTELQCIQRCGDEQALASLQPVAEPITTTTEVDSCSLTRDEGICPGNVPRFYFDQELGRCVIFSYGGCGGNTNNFESLDECVAHCGGPADSFIDVGFKGNLKPKKPFCKLSLAKGNCQATLRRFYYDHVEGNCKLFIFGGCQGNLNNFERIEECLLNCAGPDPDSETGLELPYNSSSILTSENKHVETYQALLDFSSTAACHLPKDFGSCSSNHSLRFYYESDSKQCRKFWFSGCGGNQNNFLSALDCVRSCGGSFEVDPLPALISASPNLTVTSKESPPLKRQLSRFTTNTFFKSRSNNASRADNIIVVPAKLQRTDSLKVEVASFETVSQQEKELAATESSNTLAKSERNSSVVKLERGTYTTTVPRTTTASASASATATTTSISAANNPTTTKHDRVTISSFAKAREAHPREPAPVHIPKTAAPARRGSGYRPREPTTFRPQTKSRKPTDVSLQTTTVSPLANQSSTTTTRSYFVRSRAKFQAIPRTSHSPDSSLNAANLELEETLEVENIPDIKPENFQVSTFDVSEPKVGIPVEDLPRKLTSIRSFCRTPPILSETAKCSRPDPIYFYNVTLSDCQSSTKGFCGRSRNRFSTRDACMKACVLDSETSIINEVEKRPSSQPTSRKFTRRFGSN